MTNPNYTHAVLVVDRSGSMASMRDGAQSSINQFFKDQADGEGSITVSLYDFDAYNVTGWSSGNLNRIHGIDLPMDTNGCYRRVFGPIDAAEAPQYVLEPRGGTALRDAAAGIMQETGKFLAGLPEAIRPGKVIFAIITDGQENSSRLISSEALRNMIKTQEDVYGWEFVFMGANIDAEAVGFEYGVQNVIQYQNTSGSYAGATSAFSTAVLSSRATHTSYGSNHIHRNVDSEGNAS